MIYVLGLLVGLVLGIVAASVAFIVMLRRAQQTVSNEYWVKISVVTTAWGVGVFFAMFIVLPTILTIFANLYTDHLWFSSVGFHSVWKKQIIMEWSAFGAGALGTILILWSQAALAKRFWGDLSPYSGESRTHERIVQKGDRYQEEKRSSAEFHAKDDFELLKNAVLWIFILLVAISVGSWVKGSWQTIMLFFNSTSFGQADPVFGRDVSFYVFQLPFWEMVRNVLAVVWLLAATEVIALHGFYGFRTGEMINEDYNNPGKFGARCWDVIRRHGGLILIGFMALGAMDQFLSRLHLVLSDHGTLITGANVTDIQVRSWGYLLIFAVFLLCMAAVAFNVLRKPKPDALSDGWGVRSARTSLRTMTLAIMVIVSVWFIFLGILPLLYQTFHVGPNELSQETVNISRGIAGTRAAYGLSSVQENQFPVTDYLTKDVVAENQATFDNLRIQDWRTLLATLNPLQALRPYYTFQDVDIDRMNIGGQVRQIMISPRDLNLSGGNVPGGWINSHFVYTHGFGVVISPVNEVANEGLPEFLVKDIPPAGDVNITQPRIYFSTNMSGWVIVKSKQRELDYPSGDQNNFNTYDGKDGVGVGSLLRRATFAIRTGNLRLLLQSPVEADSKIILLRSIEDRVKKIAPFLRYDADPYITVVDGRLVWIWDAYTTSGNYPYSRQSGYGYNYIRNSVKVVIDAYDGTTTFYQMDPEDPIIRTWAKIFPHLFTSVLQAPSEVVAHFRYPEDLLNVQSRIFARYHVQSATTFYNKEDFWSVPNELFAGEELSRSQAYYVTMTVPGETTPEFILMQPFTPANKENAIAWLAGRCDPDHYGQLVAFLFPKDKLVFGTQQVESRINVNEEISQLKTLWGQAGSRVISGNTLMLPVGNTIVFAEPLFIQATQEANGGGGATAKTAGGITEELTGGQMAIPELRRVIVSNGDHLVVASTVNEAINGLLSYEQPAVPPIVSAPGQTTSTPGEQNAAFGPLITQLYQYETAAEQAVGRGDWDTFGKEMTEVTKVLDELKSLAGQ